MARLIRQPSFREGHKGSIWQGGADDVSSGTHYDLIILCAEEFQPEAHIIATDKTQVVHAPNEDHGEPLDRVQATVAIAASRVVARAFREGKKVLVSCMQGRNRSGLVSALALHDLYGMPGKRCGEYVKSRVPNALTNPSFNDFLASIEGRGQ